MTLLPFYALLVGGALVYRTAALCPDGEVCAAEDGDHSSMLQKTPNHKVIASRLNGTTSQTQDRFCEPGSHVACPWSDATCAGNECCPGVQESGGLAFPCPSADITFSQCPHNNKVSDCSKPKAYTIDDIYEQFNSMGRPSVESDNGGLLVHMIDTRHVTADLSSLTDCAKHHRKSCGAWSFLRKDLPPVAFNMPSFFQKRVGIVLKPDLVWPITTGMAPIDSNTNQRTVCSNEMSGDYTIPTHGNLFKCMVAAAEEEGINPRSKFVQPSETGFGQQNVKAACDTTDFQCMFVNSGGCMTVPEVGNWASCQEERSRVRTSFKDFQKCFEFKKVNESYTHVFFKNPCKPCSNPYYCIPEEVPKGWFSNPDYDSEKDEFRAYVGSDGSGMVDLFFKPFVTGPVFAQSTTNRMCKWRRRDWTQWVESSRRVYQRILEAAEDVSVPDATLAPGLGRGYLWAQPHTAIYLENEVNLYAHPDTTSDEYKWHNELVRTAIMAVYVDRRTCVEQLAQLNGVETVMPDGTVLSNAEERCRAYGVHPEREREHIESDTKQAIKLQKILPGTVMLEATFSSAAFPDKVTWRQARDRDVQFDKVFREYHDPA